MTEQANQIYEFGPFRLEPAERRLRLNGQLVQLTPKAFDTLLVLVSNHGHAVGKDELTQKVWPDAVVEEATLAQNISTLRRVLGEDTSGQQYIETVSKHGYRFVAPVRSVGGDEVFEPGDVGEEPPLSRQSAAAIEKHKRLRVSSTFVAIAIILLLAGAAAIGYAWLSANKATSPNSEPVIAVLPFQPISPEGRDEYLELGIPDGLVTKLSNLNRIVVRSTSSLRSYGGPTPDPVAAGRELKADAVVEGSIQRWGDRIRVRARLVNVNDGRTLWAGEFDEKFTDIFAVQDSISEQITRALALKLTGGERQRLSKNYTRDPEAYQLYVTGRYFWNHRNEEGLKKAIDYFQRAIMRDPNYALAYAGLADSYVLLNFYSAIPLKEAFPKAKVAAERAVQIDDTLAEAHTPLAHVKYSYDWDWQGADWEFKRAIELNPNYATAHQWYAEYLALMGRTDESIAHVEHARELDPQSIIINTELGYPYMFARRCDEAIERFRKALEMDPNFPAAIYYTGRCYEQKGMFAEAITEYRKALPLFGGNPIILGALGYANAASKRKAEARDVLNDLLRLSKQRPVSPFVIATVYAGLGDKEQAFAWLEKAYHERDDRIELLKVDPHLDNLRGDPRFADLMRRVNLAP